MEPAELNAFAAYVPYIGNVFAKVAPERASELNQSEKLTIEVLNTPEFLAESVCTERLIRVSTGALELLWCAAHFNFVICDEYPKAQQSESSEWDLTANPRTLTALLLFERALESTKAKKSSPWPRSAPFPEPLSTNRDVHLANEIFLRSAAFLLHHEYQHVQLGHLPNLGPSAIPNEKQADRAATEFILGKAPNAQVVQERAWGILSAILTIYRFELRTGARHLDHPSPLERLEYCIREHIEDADCDLYAFASILMQVHGSLATGTALKHEGKTFSSVLGELMYSAFKAQQ